MNTLLLVPQVALALLFASGGIFQMREEQSICDS